MNENETITSTEIDDIWGDNYVEPEDDIEETDTEAEDEVTEDEADQPSEETEEEAEDGNEAEDEAKPEADEQKDDSYTLKHMDEVKTVSREEVIAYAQKGMDYDRIRQERDELRSNRENLEAENKKLKDYESFLNRLADDSHRTVDQLMEETEIQMLIAQKKDKGIDITEDAAREEIQLRKDRAAFEAEKAALKSQSEAKEEQPDPVTTRNQDEFLEFAKNFPDVKAEEIPKEVWDEFSNGKSLTAAYTKFENKQLKEKIKTLEQNAKNRERSTGSRKTSGASTNTSIYDDIWNSD